MRSGAQRPARPRKTQAEERSQARAHTGAQKTRETLPAGKSARGRARAGKASRRESPRRGFFRDNALSIVMFACFLLFWLGQALTGWRSYQQDQTEHGLAAYSLGQYLISGDFVEATFENWESEFLQMAAFLWLSSFLIQRGSAESKDPADKEQNGDPRARMTPDSPAPVHRGGWALRLYSHSLGLALAGLFVLSFVLHAIGGARAHSKTALAHGKPALSTLQFVATSTFWFQCFQNWQSEFLSVGAVIVLSIYLRQRGSPESKPVQAPHSQTGE